MKNAFSFVASIIVSVLLVFCILGVTGAGIAKGCATEKNFKSISEKYDLDDKVYSELEKYFHERSSSTGIPEDVYMKAIDTEYLNNIINQTIDDGFQRLNGSYSPIDLENKELESSIDTFFNDYADSINYKKDEKFEKKLNSTKNNAYNIIREYCDVYKFDALANHGVISKVSKIYTKIDLIMIGAASIMLILLVALIIINIEAKSEAIYWSGVSALIAGIISITPCAYLLITNYFSSFSVKQAQIYTAYTETMKMFTNNFIHANVVLAICGIILIVIYGIVKPKMEKRVAA